MRKNIKIILTLTLILTLSTSLSASSLIRDITGKENKGIIVKYNSQVQNLKDGNGSPVYPVIINGSTYLPVRAIADMLGADITWDGSTKTISITGNTTKKDVDSAVPTDLPSTNNNSNSNRTETSKTEQRQQQTSNLGTLENPIDIGTAYSYNFTEEYPNNKKNADYTVTITDVDPISIDEIQDLGFERPDENAIMEYVMVSMKIDVTNATYEGNEHTFLNLYYPKIRQVETTQGNWINNKTMYDFEGCLYDELDKVTRDSDDYMIEIGPNDSKKYSYSTEGKILVAVLKDSNNLLVIEDENDDDWDAVAYFKLY